MAYPPLCRCNEASVLRTSWTEDNPGRRFFTCSRRYQVSKGKCGFFLWVDDPIEDRAKEVINGLLRKLNRYERQMRTHRGGLTLVNGSEQSASSIIGPCGSGKVEEPKLEYKSGLYVMCVAVVIGVIS
ncbi:DNA-(apurinic or apyrimidinic site) endonuclease 2 [Linum perenne]